VTTVRYSCYEDIYKKDIQIFSYEDADSDPSSLTRKFYISARSFTFLARSKLALPWRALTCVKTNSLWKAGNLHLATGTWLYPSWLYPSWLYLHWLYLHGLQWDLIYPQGFAQEEAHARSKRKK